MRRQNNFIYLHSENECVMELFKGQSLLEFTERFKTDLDCEEYLASLKWEDGIFTASKTHNSKTYTVTQIRRNKKEVIKEIKNKKTNEKTNKTIYEIITY